MAGAAGDVAKYTDEVAEAASKAGKHADDVSKAVKKTAGKAVSESGKYSLSNVEARKCYLEQEAKILDMIDKSLSLEEQAKQAFNLRNKFRT